MYPWSRPSDSVCDRTSRQSNLRGEPRSIQGRNRNTPTYLSERPLVLEPGSTNARRIPLSTFWPVPALSTAYVVHKYYRRYSPRRLPPFTSMRLWELYASVAIMFTLAANAHAMETDMILNHKDLFTIDLARERCKKFLESSLSDSENETGPKDSSAPSNETLAKWDQTALDALRKESYPTRPGVWGKVSWWYDTFWADRTSWHAVGRLMLTETDGLDGTMLHPDRREDREDWVVCVTHLASVLNDESYLALVTYTFGFLIPVAVLARWTRRPALCRPINGLQRLLFGAWIYCGDMRIRQRNIYLRRVKDRRKTARTLVHVFGGFDDEIGEARFWRARGL